MKHTLSTNAPTDFSKPVEPEQTRPEPHPAAACTSQPHTDSLPSGPLQEATLETLAGRLERAFNLVAREGVARMELKYLDRLIAHYERQKTGAENQEPSPPERELSQRDEDEFQFLVHSGVKLFHPALVHPNRTELAKRIYEDFQQVYCQGDLEQLWTFLRASQAELQTIPVPPIENGEERAHIKRALQRIPEVKS